MSRGVLLQDDNVRGHVISKTVTVIREMCFKCLPNPPYSPDLRPSDYRLFREMKRPLVLESQIKQWGKATPKELYATGLEKLPEQRKRYVDIKDEDIERLMMNLYTAWP